MLVRGSHRDIGLGGYPTVTLAQARDWARKAHDKVERGIDPVEEQKTARARPIEARRKRMLFSEAVDKALAAKLDAFRNEKHRAQWRCTLDGYAIRETATRLRGRIEAVPSWATVAGHRSGDNPARGAGNFRTWRFQC